MAEYAERWMADRRMLGIRSAGDDEGRLRHHVLPLLGPLRLTQVRPAHARETILELRREGRLAPRTIHRVAEVASSLFRSAYLEELIERNPYELPRGIVPKPVDGDPEWRETALFTRAEVLQLCTSPEILADRRVLYTLLALTGARREEIATMRWSQWNAGAVPLGKIALPRTKCQKPRSVPVLPALDRVLAAWRSEGWCETYGRAPEDGDFVVPTRRLTVRAASATWESFQRDLGLLGLRARRVHDLRRTFVSLAQEDGARRELLEVITHGPRGTIVGMYTSFSWSALCAELLKLRLDFCCVATPTGFEGVAVANPLKIETQRASSAQPRRGVLHARIG